jgi:hypothetical protein
MKLPHLVTLVVIAGEMHQSKAHYFDRGLFASVSMKTMVFVTCRWGNSAKRLGTDAPLMHFSPQRDVVMHCRPERDVVMHTLSCNNSGCIKLNTDICGEIKSRHETVQPEKCEILYAFTFFIIFCEI